MHECHRVQPLQKGGVNIEKASLLVNNDGITNNESHF